MLRKNNWIDEIDSGNALIRIWAFEYLAQHGLTHGRNIYGGEQIRRLIDEIPNNAYGLLLLKRMYAAYAQKKQRSKKNGRKAYNFVMSTQAKARLEALAKEIGRPLNETLESLIMKEYWHLKTEKDAEKNARKKKAIFIPPKVL
ncbi:MAG TPA: hypothetical protein PK002_07700 [Cellvibrio sp.]|nr:hypothetical protein [Cellvibrio sp.]